MLSTDTISTSGRQTGGGEKKERKTLTRQVRTIRPWDYQIPCRFVSANRKNAETLLVVLRGRVGLLLFPSSGKLVQTIRLGGPGERREYRVPGGTYFVLITLVQESAVLEVQPSAMGVRVEWLPEMPNSRTDEARELWRRWFHYFQAPSFDAPKVLKK